MVFEHETFLCEVDIECLRRARAALVLKTGARPTPYPISVPETQDSVQSAKCESTVSGLCLKFSYKMTSRKVGVSFFFFVHPSPRTDGHANVTNSINLTS